MNKELAKHKLSIYRFEKKINNNNFKNALNKILKQHCNQTFTEKEFVSFLNKFYYDFYNEKISIKELSILIDKLISWDFLEFFDFNNKEKLYYVSDNSNLLLNALSKKYKNAFFSHHTASYIYGFTDPINNIFMSNLYQSKTNKKGIINQDDIDRVFYGKMRQVKRNTLITNNNFTLEKKLYLLSQYANISKYTLEDLGIVQKQINGFYILISSFERLLIESIVRPSYFPNLESIIDIYAKAKKYINCDKLLKILNNLNYTYPYHQSIGFLLEITNYNKQQINLFQNIPMNIDFYLVYNSSDYDLEYSKKWHLFYPKNILNYI